MEERRRIALHRAAAETRAEEVADTLVELVAPSGNELATREDIQGVLAAMTAMDKRLNARFRAAEATWDARFGAWRPARGPRGEVGHAGSTDSGTSSSRRSIVQTRTLVISQLVALVVTAGLAFGLR